MDATKACNKICHIKVIDKLYKQSLFNSSIMQLV